jgi:hypothetical protein
MFLTYTSHLLLKESGHTYTYVSETQSNKMFLLWNMSVSNSSWSHTNIFVTFLQYLKQALVPEVRPWLQDDPWGQVVCPAQQVLCCSTGPQGKHWGGLAPGTPTRKSEDSGLDSGVVPRTSMVAMRPTHWHCNQGW